MKTRLDVLKQHAETTKVLKFQGWMRELITMLEAAEATINRQKGALQNDREECEALGRERDEAEQTIKALEVEIKDAEHDISSYMDINKGLLNDMPCPACELREFLKQEQESCEHGKGLTDYCEPCGRINGG